MDDRFLDAMSEVFFGEFERWGLRANKTVANPFKLNYAVFRKDDSGDDDCFSELHSFDTLDVASEEMWSRRNRAASRVVLEGVLDGVAELVEEFRVNLDDERRAQDQIAALIRAQMLREGE